jgi:two-component system chemotaxis response regulator CheB
MIKVLIVDDSASIRIFLEGVFSADPEFQVAGFASNGEEALRAVERLAPDVITMDIDMPQMNGLVATSRIMATHPTPIVILSGVLDTQEIVSSFRALEAGALAALPKPRGVGHPDHDQDVRTLIQTVKLMSEIKVVKRWALRGMDAPHPLEPVSAHPMATPQVVAIGASTGGPPVIQGILAGIGKNFPLPILIVQHMAHGFIHGFAEWLALSSGMQVHIAAHGGKLLPGHVYIAPDDMHMQVEAGGRIKLSANAPDNGLRPSVAALFRSVADVYGKNAVGILLTGMGTDGAGELLLMKQKGAVTIAQDKTSSVIYGMPGEAAKRGAATYTMSPERIAVTLAQMTKGRRSA